jgi:hypothetical protein
MRLLSYRLSYYAGKPEELFKELIWYPFRDLVFRVQNGYFKSDTWSLDYATAKWILPRIKGLVKFSQGWPAIEGDPNCEKPEDWARTINLMIDAFQGIVDEEDNWIEWHKQFELETEHECAVIKKFKMKDVDYDKQRRYMERRQEGLTLFGKYFQHLWW